MKMVCAFCEQVLVEGSGKASHGICFNCFVEKHSDLFDGPITFTPTKQQPDDVAIRGYMIVEGERVEPVFRSKK
jgi:hypothetical protein